MKRHSKKLVDKLNVLMIGPSPPPYGGIAIWVKNITSIFSKSDKVNIKLYRTGKRVNNIPSPIQAIIEILLLLRFLIFSCVNDFDICHVHTSSYLGFVRNSLYVLICKKILRKKVVLHIHGGGFIDFYTSAGPIVKKIITRTLNISDYLIVTSPSWVTKIKKLKITNQKNITYLYNGVDPKIFYPRNKVEIRKSLKLPLSKKIILNIGANVPEKGQIYLIHAIHKLVNHRKDILCIIIGDGPLKGKLEKEVKNLGLEKYIKLVGTKPHSEIPAWMNASDLFVLPSLRESFGVVQIEAMACGVPVVATYNGGSEEVITSEDYGLLCPPADPECLAEKILKALEKEWDREKIRKYAEQFTWENIATRILEVYQERE